MFARATPRCAAVNVCDVWPTAESVVSCAAASASSHTAVTFQSGSYWVPSAEMEKLWAFSTGLKTNAGRITIEARPSNEADGAELARKRANRIAELIKQNNIGNRFDVDVKVISATGAVPRVDVYYSRQL
jgi:hypothetical protein